MTSFASPRAVLLIALLAAPAAGQTLDSPRRVLVEPTLPGGRRDPSPEQLVRVGDRLYFTAYDLQHGRELWTADDAGTDVRRVADLCPGACNSYPEHLELLGDRLLFTADDGGGPSLFSLRAGRLEVVIRLPYPVVDTEIFGGQLYLALEKPYSDFKLFRTSGAPGDWHHFEDLCTDPTPPYCFAPELFVHGGFLYYLRQGALRKAGADGQVASLRTLVRADRFEILDDSRFVFRACAEDLLPGFCRLFRSDGSAAGTRPVNPSSADTTTRYPEDLRRWNGRVYFAQGSKVMRTDGTADGTQLAFELLQQDAVRIGILATTATKLFYYRYLGEDGSELRAYSSGGTDDLLLGPLESGPRTVGQAGDRVLFANDGRFILTDGTPAGTSILDGWELYSHLRVGAGLGSQIFVSASRDDRYSSQLWRFDGTGNASLVLDALPEAKSDSAVPYSLGPDALLAWTSRYPRQLYRVDPSSLQAEPVDASLDLEPGPLSGSTMLAKDRTDGGLPEITAITPGSVTTSGLKDYTSFIPAGDGLFYFRPPGGGQKLAVTDGTVAGTRELLDLSPGAPPPRSCYHCPVPLPNAITVSGDNVFFVGAVAPGESGIALWVYHRPTGRSEALLRVYDSDPELKAFGRNKVAFFFTYPEEDVGMWVSDGTLLGTRKPFEDRYEQPAYFDSVGERLFYFTGYPSRRLGSSDLEPGGAYLLLDRDSLDLGESAAVGDQLFFVATTLEHGEELWATDGTPGGTHEIDIRPGPASSRPAGLRAVGRRLVFAADDGVHGHEPFVSDGTAEGTLLLADLAPGEPASSPVDFAALGERLFFQADDGESGRGLWALDLPAAAPACPADRLCLLGDRFEVEVKTSVGAVVFEGRRTRSWAESGVFSFFGPDNWEMMVKVLDGCALNQNFWVYAAAATDLPFELKVTDRAGGEQKVYRSQGGRAAPILDGAAFATCGAAPAPPRHPPVLPLGEVAPRCPEIRNAFCFGGGRFVAKVLWQTADGAGSGHTEPYGSRDSGLFTFFSPSNWELMVKVLDGCAINGRHWVFVAGTTDVGWQLEVEDRATGAVRRYGSELGNPQPAITDTDAFGGCG
jgi:ELWxxDGT repeat protein